MKLNGFTLFLSHDKRLNVWRKVVVKSCFRFTGSYSSISCSKPWCFLKASLFFHLSLQNWYSSSFPASGRSSIFAGWNIWTLLFMLITADRRINFTCTFHTWNNCKANYQNHTKSKLLLKANSDKNKAQHVGKHMDNPTMQPYARE